ncbi:MAG: mechanosensitive ion channel family protein [Candidatus Cloacimonetes bacterium]|nr:mechanosensitive ion channel family protein [Candidatus Cloacimonadota bacterium]
MTIETVQQWMEVSEPMAKLIAVGIILVLAVMAYLITRLVINRIASFVASQTRTVWDDLIIKNKVLYYFAALMPWLVIYIFSGTFPEYEKIIAKIANLMLAWVGLMIFFASLNALNAIYYTFTFSKDKPIKGYLQIVKMIGFLFVLIISISIIMGKSPIVLLSGLGAVTAILMLVFKDTILSLVASLQISFNNLVNTGDWIQIPQYQADGEVIDVALHTIKVRNWDKTITTVPTHKLAFEPFKNWRGMSEAGGRRIKRSLTIEYSSIRFCDEKLLNRLKTIPLLSEYLNDTQLEIEEFNKKVELDNAPLEKRHITNIGTFRAYISAWLKTNSHLHSGFTFLIRQLQPTVQGVPIEIYVFTNTTDWVEYEAIQSDIFDHLYAIIPQFDLKIFQQPSNSTLSKLVFPEKPE